MPVLTRLEEVERIIKERLDGYAAVTDAPASGLVQELLAIYPNAKVICTIREPDSWVKSMEGISNAATMWFLRFVLFPLPGMRYFVDYINVLRKQWEYLYNEHEPFTAKTYNRHIQWLKEIVPPERLVFFDVKEGWEPLCKALGKEIPKDIPFPNINDGEAIDRLAKSTVQRGLLRWLVVFVTLGLAMVPFWFV